LPVLYEWIFEKESPAEVMEDDAGVEEHPAKA
jgi:hypothetical protein